MLKYYEYLYRIRSVLRDNCGITVLSNLETFPIDLDPSLREYHEKIAATIERVRLSGPESYDRERYYIHKTRPFFVGGRIYYEVTFHRAINRVSKFDRIIAFTDIDMTDKYAAMLTLWRASIRVLDQSMPITLVLGWEVSIRPCEFDNFARLLGISTSVQTNSAEYQFLMRWLTVGSGSLLDLIDMTNEKYAIIRNAAEAGATRMQIFPVLDEARRIVNSAAPGCNILRYLMLRMHNQRVKPLHHHEGCSRLSHLKLHYSCIPFDSMPFCTSLPGHNPRYWDLAESLNAAGRNHELLARRVKNNVERHGVLYTPAGDLEEFGDVNGLLSTYNSSSTSSTRSVNWYTTKGTSSSAGMRTKLSQLLKSLRSMHRPESMAIPKPSSAGSMKHLVASTIQQRKMLSNLCSASRASLWSMELPALESPRWWTTLPIILMRR